MFQPADGGHYREYYGFNFIWEWVSIRIQKVEDGSLGKLNVTAKYNHSTEFVDEFNTVIYAIGDWDWEEGHESVPRGWKIRGSSKNQNQYKV